MLCLELWYNALLVLMAGYMENASVAIAAFAICINVATLELMIPIGFLSGTSMQPVFSGAAVGCGRQTMVAWVNLVSYYVVGIPLGLVLAYVVNLEVRGIWIGMISGVAVQTLVLGFLIWRLDWDEEVMKASARLNRWFKPQSEDSLENSSENRIQP
ncbi:hypothetical protein MLD38_006054 [Melastoma candidum]|uniref:Uncharacterized protein n=1 Tax=Melastoma candidum TaxID=119954 RepID=A0ACB9RV46_9MYRT|nr:hypothetical protein MLD38_006054 [Melastoma candidum]